MEGVGDIVGLKSIIIIILEAECKMAWRRSNIKWRNKNIITGHSEAGQWQWGWKREDEYERFQKAETSGDLAYDLINMTSKENEAAIKRMLEGITMAFWRRKIKKWKSLFTGEK